MAPILKSCIFLYPGNTLKDQNLDRLGISPAIWKANLIFSWPLHHFLPYFFTQIWQHSILLPKPYKGMYENPECNLKSECSGNRALKGSKIKRAMPASGGMPLHNFLKQKTKVKLCSGLAACRQIDKWPAGGLKGWMVPGRKERDKAIPETWGRITPPNFPPQLTKQFVASSGDSAGFRQYPFRFYWPFWILVRGNGFAGALDLDWEGKGETFGRIWGRKKVTVSYLVRFHIWWCLYKGSFLLSKMHPG